MTIQPRLATGLFCFTFTTGATAHGGHGGSAQLETYNNDRAIAAQVYGGLHEDAGAVKITFYGNIAFEIETRCCRGRPD